MKPQTLTDAGNLRSVATPVTRLSSPNQYLFEVARDIATLMRQMKDGEVVNISISAHRHGLFDLFDWGCDYWNQPCGPSEAAQAMRHGYESVFGSV